MRFSARADIAERSPGVFHGKKNLFFPPPGKVIETEEWPQQNCSILFTAPRIKTARGEGLGKVVKKRKFPDPVLTRSLHNIIYVILKNTLVAVLFAKLLSFFRRPSCYLLSAGYVDVCRNF